MQNTLEDFLLPENDSKLHPYVLVAKQKNLAQCVFSYTIAEYIKNISKVV